MTQQQGETTDTVWMTQESYDKLSAELAELKGPVRDDIVAKIAAARDEGDLKENGGYHAAREEQGRLEARIRQLEDQLRRAEVGDVIAERTVTQTGIERKATVQGIGVAAIDADSATVLASGQIDSSYPDDELELEPQAFRYEVSLVFFDGAWLVDDLDDLDDGLGSFGTSSSSEDLGPRGCQAADPSGSATDAPSGSATDAPSDQATTEGSTAP